MKRRYYLWLMLPTLALVFLGFIISRQFPYNGLWYHENKVTHTRDYTITFWYGDCEMFVQAPNVMEKFECSYNLKGSSALLSCAPDTDQKKVYYLVEPQENGQFLILTPVTLNQVNEAREKGGSIKLIKRGRM